MMRVIPVPEGVPEGFDLIVAVFAETNTKGNTQTTLHASDAMITSLRGMPMANRMRVIKKLLYAIEQMLLEYSNNPDETKVREIS